MKAILISIKPKYVADILNGRKTIEIRKTLPKCDLPIDVYIYCTKDKKYANLINRGGFLTGMVVAKFTLNMVEHFEYETLSRDISGYWLDNGKEFENKGTCLTDSELWNYIKSGNGYAWHIDNIIPFDKPKELSEFHKIGYDEAYNLAKCGWDSDECLDYHKSIEWLEEKYGLTKAPQSWCYIEE